MCFYSIHLTLKMASAQLVETSINVTSKNSPQVYTHPDDHNLRTNQAGRLGGEEGVGDSVGSSELPTT